MTQTFEDWLRSAIEKTGRSQKDIAHSVAEKLDAAGVKTTVDTISSKLSKLLNGNTEGESHFLSTEQPLRLVFLAEEIGSTAEEVMRRHKEAAAVRTLVLDPRLPGYQLDYLLTHEMDGTYRCIRVVVDDRAAEHVIDRTIVETAQRERDAIIVLSGRDGVRRFDLAGCKASFLVEVPRGFQLFGHANLVPVPPPSPPQRFSKDGQPLVPLTDSWRPPPNHDQDRYGWGHRDQWEAHREIASRVIQPAEQRGETPCLSLHDALLWYRREGGPLAHVSFKLCEKATVTLSHVLRKPDAPTNVWIEGDRIRAVGPAVKAVADALAEHHQVTEPDDLNTQREFLESTNPWRLAERASADTHLLHPLVAEVTEWARSKQRELEKRLSRAFTGTCRLLEETEAGTVRERLRALVDLGAEVELAGTLFSLRRAAEADLARIDEGVEGEAAFVADLGSGYLMKLRLMAISDDRAPLRRTGAVIDAGDVAFQCSIECASQLAGSPAAVLRHRARAEEERSRYDDDDD